MSGGLLVVGSGPAGLEAARAYREQGGRGAVTIVTEDAHPPYLRPPLSKGILRGTMSPDELDLEDVSFFEQHGIDLLLGRRVQRIDIGRRAVVTEDGAELPYVDCLLATGATPVRPDVPGVETAHVLRSRADAERLVSRAGSGGSAVVVGSGFIGCEAAASLAVRGLEVTLLSKEPAPQAARLGDEVAARIRGWLDSLGVRTVTGQELTSVEEEQLVVLAVGVTPQVELAEQAGARVEDGRVVVDAAMRTSVPSLWAAGDVVKAHNAAAGRHLAVEHWGEAVRMGEVCGSNVAGGSEVWAQVPGFWSEIGEHTLKYAAWGDGFDQVRLVDHGAGAFTAWYGRDDVVVGVLTHDRDEDYERGSELVESAVPAYAEVSTR